MRNSPFLRREMNPRPTTVRFIVRGRGGYRKMNKSPVGEAFRLPRAIRESPLRDARAHTHPRTSRLPPVLSLPPRGREANKSLVGVGGHGNPKTSFGYFEDPCPRRSGNGRSRETRTATEKANNDVLKNTTDRMDRRGRRSLQVRAMRTRTRKRYGYRLYRGPFREGAVSAC